MKRFSSDVNSFFGEQEAFWSIWKAHGAHCKMQTSMMYMMLSKELSEIKRNLQVTHTYVILVHLEKTEPKKKKAFILCTLTRINKYSIRPDR